MLVLKLYNRILPITPNNHVFARVIQMDFGHLVLSRKAKHEVFVKHFVLFSGNHLSNVSSFLYPQQFGLRWRDCDCADDSVPSRRTAPCFNKPCSSGLRTSDISQKARANEAPMKTVIPTKPRKGRRNRKSSRSMTLIQQNLQLRGEK